MLHKNILAKSGLRLLDDTELETVSGGDGEVPGDDGGIVVTAPRSYQFDWSDYLSTFGDVGLSFLSQQSLVDGGGGGGEAFDWTPSEGQLVDTDGDGEWDPNGDDDGDGVLNQNEEIVVTAAATPEQAQIAYHIGSQLANERLAVFGFLYSYVGIELVNALQLAGVSAQVATGIAGSLSATTGAPTSVAESLNIIAENLREFYGEAVLSDIQANPDEYSNWIIVNGEPFDASTMDD